MITGRCECGRVKYQVNGEINDFSHCHCSQCRRLHGAPSYPSAVLRATIFHMCRGSLILQPTRHQMTTPACFAETAGLIFWWISRLNQTHYTWQWAR